jgi:hypothetical protein
VQEAGVRRVVVALHRLQVVALLDELHNVAVRLRQVEPLEVGHRGLLLGRPHVGPDQVALVFAGVALDVDLVAEGVAFRSVRQVYTLAVDIELPAVVHAPQAGFLVAPKKHRRTAVRAVGVDKADAAVRVTEGDEVLAHDADSKRNRVRTRELLGQCDR